MFDIFQIKTTVGGNSGVGSEGFVQNVPKTYGQVGNSKGYMWCCIEYLQSGRFKFPTKGVPLPSYSHLKCRNVLKWCLRLETISR